MSPRRCRRIELLFRSGKPIVREISQYVRVETKSNEPLGSSLFRAGEDKTVEGLQFALPTREKLKRFCESVAGRMAGSRMVGNSHIQILVFSAEFLQKLVKKWQLEDLLAARSSNVYFSRFPSLASSFTLASVIRFLLMTLERLDTNCLVGKCID